jgi:alpha-ketoglutarate-dependent 2,4-dichlorophenoxyacetate dioxygenase
MDDAAHVEFSRRFGELDDIRPYMTGGRKPRYEFYELFDAGNIDEQNGILDPESPRAHYGRVSTRSTLMPPLYFSSMTG